MKNIQRIILFLLFGLIISQLYAKQKQPSFLQANKNWADSVMSTLTIEEKIGQLIMVTAYSNLGASDEELIKSQIKKYKIGGVLFLKSDPYRLHSLINQYQSTSKIPLFTAIDAENGLSFRVDSTIRYPHLMALGALQNDLLIYQMGREIGQQCKILGINLNFAPVADVNNNPNNPIINYRSFGENPQLVAKKTWMLASGMQDENILVTAKHFPGHGNTSYDSHLALPTINRNYEQLRALELIPFQYCINQGINGIMSAHLNLPKIEKRGIPATLSSKIINGILRDSMQFKGLIFSDALNMKGITKHFKEGEAVVEALKAGVDVVEFVINPKSVIHAIKKSLRKGELSEAVINEKCYRVLLAKSWIATNKKIQKSAQQLHNELNKIDYQLTSRQLHKKAITVVTNRNQILPLKQLDTLKIASIVIGSEQETLFQKRLNDYATVEHFNVKEFTSETSTQQLLNKFKSYNLVIVGINGSWMSPGKKFHLTETQINLVDQLAASKNTILVHFGNPYALKYFQNLNQLKSILVTYGENRLYYDFAAQAIFGAHTSNAKLPVSINKTFKAGTGFTINKIDRLSYLLPEEKGFDSYQLNSVIDSFANMGIHEKIFPGCQILVAKKGAVIFHKAYGYYTYNDKIPLKKSAIYDWASLTKITGPLPLLMQLYDQQEFNLDDPISKLYIPLRFSNKKEITWRETLAHQARLQPWINFYAAAKSGSKKEEQKIFRNRPSKEFSIRISEHLYEYKDYKTVMIDSILKSELLPEKKYKYSGLAFYLFPEIIQLELHKTYENALQQNILKPLGANAVTFHAYKKFNKSDIVPTEQDDFFRKELLQGFVHDEGCSMFGGVSGNAGLFGTTNDLAKIMQMYLQKGRYGGQQFIKSSTIEEFTRVQYPENENRRGLGFDKPYLENGEKELKDAYPAIAVSPESFGHSGYTGTFAWADPKNELLFIFMSNRVYPTRNNTKLFDLNFRPELQQAIYECQETFKTSKY